MFVEFKPRIYESVKFNYHCQNLIQVSDQLEF